MRAPPAGSAILRTWLARAVAFLQVGAKRRGVMRPLLLAVGVALSACGGTVCDGAVKAEQGANQKSANCNAGSITVHDAQKCNSNLSKCNSDDLQEINNYGACLNALPVCSSNNEVQWSGQRQGCINQAAARISLNCFINIL